MMTKRTLSNLNKQFKSGNISDIGSGLGYAEFNDKLGNIGSGLLSKINPISMMKGLYKGTKKTFGTFNKTVGFTSQIMNSSKKVTKDPNFTNVNAGEVKPVKKKDGTADILAKMYNFMVNANNEQKIRMELLRNLDEIEQAEESKRHERLLAALHGRKLNTATPIGAPQDDSDGFFKKLLGWGVGILSSLGSFLKFITGSILGALKTVGAFLVKKIFGMVSGLITIIAKQIFKKIIGPLLLNIVRLFGGPFLLFASVAGLMEGILTLIKGKKSEKDLFDEKPLEEKQKLAKEYLSNASAYDKEYLYKALGGKERLEALAAGLPDPGGKESNQVVGGPESTATHINQRRKLKTDFDKAVEKYERTGSPEDRAEMDKFLDRFKRLEAGREQEKVDKAAEDAQKQKDYQSQKQGSLSDKRTIAEPTNPSASGVPIASEESVDNLKVLLPQPAPVEPQSNKVTIPDLLGQAIKGSEGNRKIITSVSNKNIGSSNFTDPTSMDVRNNNSIFHRASQRNFGIK